MPRGRHDHAIPADERQQMLDLYRQGISGEEIAHRLGRGVTSVYRVLRADGATRPEMAAARGRSHPRQRFTDEQEEEIVRRYVSGEPLNPLAAAYETSITTIFDILTKRGIPRRRRGQVERTFTPAEIRDVLAAWHAGDAVTAIAERLNAGTATVANLLRSCGQTPEPRVAKGEKHIWWKGGRVLDGHGYILVALTDDHPYAAMRESSGYIKEHRLVMAQHLGRVLTSNEHVHHDNLNPSDNRLSNLVLLDPATHRRLHAQLARAARTTRTPAVPLDADTDSPN